MKKTFIIIASVIAASVFSSCTKTDIEAPQNELISFQVANYMNQTKAGETAFPTTDFFGTYAWTNSANQGSQHQVLMNGETVGFVGGTWQTIDSQTKSAKNYYWPKGGNVDFISYYPAGACWFTINDTATKLSAQTEIKGNNNKTNLMYADKAIGCTYESSKDGVETLFHHALSQISVIFNTSKDNDGKGTKFEVNVTSAKFTAINTNGSIDFNCTATNGNWVAPKTWAVTSAVEDFNMTVGKISTANKTVINNVTVLPQNLESDNTLELAYTVTTTYPDNTKVSENLVASVALKDLKVASWELNKNITYTITIDPNGLNPITFLPKIADWVDADEIQINL